MSNPFSRSIKFRPGAPTPLLNYMGSENAILLEEKALRILRDIKEPIAVIAVVGSYRRGKSYFANTIHGHHDGFKLGSSVEGCTKGIDMWDTPFVHEGKRVVVFDCEGIDDPNQEVPWASKLFILCLAISSIFVFNINGVIGRDDVGKLCLMTNVASHIKPPTDSKFSPNLVVLLRDFQFDNPPDFVEYFFDKLSRVNDGAAKGVKEFFGEFNVHAIPSPGIHREQMKNMGTIKTGQLDPLFVKSIENSVKDIFKNLPPKYIEKSTMSGITFVKFLEDCVFQMNDPRNKMPLSIPSAYEATTHYVAQQAHETCLRNYEDIMTKQTNDKFPIRWDDFDKIHIKAFETSSENFIKMIIGSAKQIQSFQEKFYKKIPDLKKQFYKMNSKAIYKHNSELAYKHWNEHVMQGLVETNLFTSEGYLDAIDSFEQIYGMTAIPGQEAGKVLTEFRDHQYKSAVETLKNYNALHETIAKEISARQQAEQKYHDLVQKEGQLQKEISNFINEKEKISKHFEEKINHLENCFLNQEPNNKEEILRLRKEHERILAKAKEEDQMKIDELHKRLDKAESEKNNFWTKTKTVIGIVSAGVSLASLFFGVPLPIF